MHLASAVQLLARDRPTRAALLTSVSSIWLLVGYEMVRSPSNTLFKAAYGAEGLNWILALAPFSLLFFLYLYGRSLTRLGPRKTLHLTLAASAAGVFLCWLLIEQGIPLGAALLILLREAYAVLVIEQYWSFLNSTLDEPRAKRMNGPVTGLSSLGGVVGGFIVAHFSGVVGTGGWLLWAVLPFLPSMVFAELAYRTAGEPQNVREPDKTNSPKHRDPMGLHLFRKHPLLLLLFAVILCTQVCSALLDIHFQTLLQQELPQPELQTAYSGRLFMWLNASSFAIQFLVAPVLLRWFPLVGIQTAIPVINLLATLYAFQFPSLTTAAAAFLVFKGMDYSIFRASKEILYIPFSFDVRFRAKEIIDAFGYRFGKGGASFLLAIARKSGAAVSTYYLPIAMLAAGVWLGLMALLMSQRKEARARTL